jgi:peptidoglycan/LPS O-acetylase OafA/YrhL
MTLRKIEDIELLRGFGMLLVLIGHVPGNLIHWTSPAIGHFYHYVRGSSGVDLFFAISGFVIVRDLYPKLTGSPDRRSYANISLAFWIRRVWRIFPLAWLWLSVILLAAAFFNKSGVFHSFDAALDGTVAAIFQYYNYRFALCFGHYDCGANFYYWTLSLEEQFYFLLPFAILLFHKRLPYLLACLVVFQVFYPHRSVMMETFRTDALLFGMLIAVWSVSSSYRTFEMRFLSRHRFLRLAVILALYIALAADARIYEGRLAPYYYGVVSLLCAALVLVGSYDRNYLMVPSALKNVLMWIGSRSCSLYMVHIPAYYLAYEIWFRIAPPGTVFNASYTFKFLLTGGAIVLSLGELSYRFVESPSRRKGTQVSASFLKRRMAQQQIAGAAL